MRRDASKRYPRLPEPAFSTRPLQWYCPENKERQPGGEASRRLVFGGEDMRPDLAFSSAKWNSRKNRLPKMPQDALSVGGRYHDLRQSCRDLTR